MATILFYFFISSVPIFFVILNKEKNQWLKKHRELKLETAKINSIHNCWCLVVAIPFSINP